MNVWKYLGEPSPPLVRLFDPLPRVGVVRERTALVIVDMDTTFASRNKGLVAIARTAGIQLDYFRRRLPQVIENNQKLQTAFRRARLKLAYTKARTGGEHRIGGFRVRPLLKNGMKRVPKIISELTPREDEIIIEKTTPGPFGVTQIDSVLRMHNIQVLVVTGVTTDQCVEATVRGAFDFGYQVILVEDATASLTHEMHASALRVMADWFCRVWTTDEVLKALAQLS